MLFWTALKLNLIFPTAMVSFRDVLFWTALKLLSVLRDFYISFRDVLFWTALKLDLDVSIHLNAF